MFLATGVVIALLGSAAALTPAVEITEPNPKTMSQAEIRAFNASLESNHKYYIRCTRTVAIGSLVKKLFSCRTNEQWLAADARGNQEARDIMEEMQSKSWQTGR